jgi:zinc transporter 1/2/3
VDPNFKVLFVVIIFHRESVICRFPIASVLKENHQLETFEGLGIGSRLAYLDLPSKYSWVLYMGGILYGLTTPIGIATGLGVRSTYNPGSTTASIVSGVMDSLSAGILIYTGLVEVSQMFICFRQYDFLI